MAQNRIRVRVHRNVIEDMFKSGNLLDYEVIKGIPADSKLVGIFMSDDVDVCTMKFLTSDNSFRYDEIIDINFKVYNRGPVA